MRDLPSVEVTETDTTEVSIDAEPETMKRLRRALSSRKLSAMADGQETLATADGSVRQRLDNAQ